MEKLTKKDKNYIFTIIILAILLILSLFYNFIGGFGIEHALNCVSEVGDDYTLNLKQIGAQSKSFALFGSSLPNDKIKQKFVVVLPDMQTDGMLLRAKANLMDTEIVLMGFETWLKNEDDGYYYYSEEIYPNQSIGLCSEISWGDVELKNSMVYFVEFVIEYYKVASL